MNDIASKSDTSVRTSLLSLMLKPIAEALAIPTCSVSFRSVICFFIRTFIQVGFKFRYVSCFRFIVFLHYVRSEVKKSFKVNLLP